MPFCESSEQPLTTSSSAIKNVVDEVADKLFQHVNEFCATLKHKNILKGVFSHVRSLRRFLNCLAPILWVILPSTASASSWPFSFFWWQFYLSEFKLLEIQGEFVLCLNFISVPRVQPIFPFSKVASSKWILGVEVPLALCGGVRLFLHSSRKLWPHVDVLWIRWRLPFHLGAAHSDYRLCSFVGRALARKLQVRKIPSFTATSKLAVRFTFV